jgi:archaellum component FlaC
MVEHLHAYIELLENHINYLHDRLDQPSESYAIEAYRKEIRELRQEIQRLDIDLTLAESLLKG